MTKGERRKLRKQARAEGRPLAGELALGRGDTQAQPPHGPPTGTSEAVAQAFIHAAKRPHGRTFRYYNQPVIDPKDVLEMAKCLLEQPHIRECMRALADYDRGDSQVEFTETPKGKRALERWAENYETHNGAPDSPEDV